MLHLAARFAPAEHTQEEPELPVVAIIDVPANDAVVLDIPPPDDDSKDIVIVLGDEPEPTLSLDDPAFAQLSDSGEKRVGFAPDTVDPVPGKKKKKKAGKKKKGDLDLPGPPDFVRVMEGEEGGCGVVEVPPGEVVVVVGEGDGNAGAGEGAGVFDVVPVPEIVAVVEDPGDANAGPEAMAVVVDGQGEDGSAEEDAVVVVGGSEDVDVAQDPEAGGPEAIIQALDVVSAPPLGVDVVEVLPPEVLAEEESVPVPTSPAQFEELPSLPGGFPPADLVDLAPPFDDQTAGADIVLIDDAEAEPKPKKKKKKSRKKVEDLPVLDLSIGEDAAVVDGMADGPPDSAIVIIGDQAGPDAAVVVMDSAPAEEIAPPEEGNAEGDVVVVFEAVTLPPGDVEDVTPPEMLAPAAVSVETKEEAPGEGALPAAVVAHDTKAHELIPASEPVVVVEVSPVEAPEATGLPPTIAEDTGEAVAVPEEPPLDLPPPVDLQLPPPSDPLLPPEPPIPAPPPAAVPEAPPPDSAPNSTIDPPAPDPIAIPSPPPDPPLSASTTSDTPGLARPTHRRHRSSTSHRADHWTRPARKRRESDVSATSTRPSASASATSNTKPTPISTSTSDHRSRRHSHSSTNAFSRDEAERRERRRAERAEDERRAREAAEAAEREEEERRARRAARREARKTAEAAAERERAALAAAQAAEDEERRRRRRERRRGGEDERGVGSDRVRRRGDGAGGGGGEKRPSLLKAFTIQGESVRMRESEVLRERPRVRRVESERSRRDEGRRGSRVVREEPRTILGALRRAFLPL